MGIVRCAADWDFIFFAEILGIESRDMVYRNGVIEIAGRTQEDLDAAVASYESRIEEKRLADAKQAAIAMIEGECGAKRAEFITVAPGQELVYTRKLACAEAFISDRKPANVGPYPWVAAEAAGRGLSAGDAADLIIGTAASWEAVGAAIEQARMKAKRAIAGALDLDAVNSAMAEFRIDLGAIPSS